ncbi:MAG: glycine betaine/proline transport system substrate-binding protein [Granulosicoccus sp.]|jgi:glycine betaine/proline transport system substrate-binding protein
MLKKRYLTAIAMAAGLLASHNAVAANECGQITIASMTWASAELIAEIDKLVLTEGYGCDAELIAGDTMPTFTAMLEKGSPDLAPELWINSVRGPLDAAVAEGELIIAAEILSDGGEEGWWIPKYVADANPQIKTPADALARPDLFPAPEDNSLGAVHNCPSGWNCQISTGNLFAAYGGVEKGFELVDTGSSAGLDGSIAKAHVRGEGWLGYYWSPTAILGRYEMVKLDMGPHDEEEWAICTAVLDCESPQINGWAKSEVFSVVTKNFVLKAGGAMDYISTRTWKNEVVNKLLAWMADNQATGEEGAAHFLENYENVWAAWMSPEAKAKLKAGL